MEEIATDNRKMGFDNKLIFKYFPHYAKHIKDNYIVPYIREQLILARQVNMPLLDFFQSMSEEDLIQMSIPSHSEFLVAVEENRLDELIETSINKWINDELGIVSRYDIKAEDITLGSYIKKKALSKFITSYTNDPGEIIELLGEIDTYSSKSDTASTNAYITILQGKIHDQLHMIEKISNTTPGLNYVYNIEQGELTFANKNYEQFVGHTADELKELGAQVLGQLIYPDDLAHSVNVLAAFNTVKDGDVISWDLRMKNNGGEYIWMRNYTSVFRRNDMGEPIEIIGIMLDVNTQKKTSEQLVEREAELLEAQEQANMASFEWDLETDEIVATPNFLKIFEVAEGLKRSELLKNIHPDDRNEVDVSRLNAISKGESFDTEYRYLANGKEKNIWSKGTLVEKNGRKVIRGTVMDITEKQTLINQLQYSDTLFKQAQDLAQIGNWSLDFKTNQLEWSGTLYHIYGLNSTQHKIDYQTVASYNHPDDAEMISQVMQLSREKQEPFDFFYRIVLPAGDIKTLHAKGDVILDKYGNAYKMHGTLQDVTRQKESENQLRNYQEFIQKITNVTPSIITTYNVRTGKYSFVNEAVEKLLGYSAQEVMSKDFPFMLSLIHPDDVDTLLEKNSIAIEEANHNAPADGNEPIVEFKYRMQHRGGGYRWLHTYGTVFERDAAGLIESVLNVSVDITDQEESERQLFQRNKELQQSNASLEEYAYVASHDLKEPLRKISTFGDRLFSSQYNNFTDDGKVYLQKIIDSSKRMQAMINDLLSISTIAGNKEFEQANLTDILAEALQSIEHKIDEKQAVVTYPKLPSAYVVPAQFRQLFQNLINNSLKFTKKDVQPEINISYKYLTYADIAAYNMVKAKKYLQVMVTDNGIGFDNIYANKIFTIFQRLHGKLDYEGTGIGLAICKKIVENHSGIIIANGILNKGATFIIIIPL